MSAHAATIAKEVNSADVVVRAKIIGTYDSPQSVDWVLYMLKVSSVWKGNVTDVYAVASKQDLTVGDEYVLAAHFERENWPLIPRTTEERYERPFPAWAPTLPFVHTSHYIKYDPTLDAVLGPGSRPFPLVVLPLTLIVLLAMVLVARRRYRRAMR